MTAIPVVGMFLAQDWSEVSCTITRSGVDSSSGSDGSTYRVNIHYTYDFEGRTYSSSRYNFVGVSSSGRSRKAEIVSQYPVNSSSVCYVNPNEPGAQYCRAVSLEYILSVSSVLSLLSPGCS